MKLSRYIVFQLVLSGVIGLLCSVCTPSFAFSQKPGQSDKAESVSDVILKERSALLLSYIQQKELSNNGDTDAHLRSRHKSKIRLSAHGATNEAFHINTCTAAIVQHDNIKYVSTLTRPGYYNFLFRYTLF